MNEHEREKRALATTMAPWFEAWRPCTLGEHHRTVTTLEVVNMVQAHLREPVEERALVQLLTEKGYKHALIGDEFRWLLMAAEA